MKLMLSVEDVSCTEAWVELTSTNLQIPATLNLLKDDNLIKTINLQTADTLLYLDSLLPNKTYNFQLTSILNPVSSNELSITTMDTTSHNFTWETFEFGTIGSSVLYDVAIIDENNIWAVGEIMIADTSENGYTIYNAVHWDGIEWSLKRIMFYTICGQQHQNAYPAASILAFSENEIWIAMKGSQIARIEGTTQIATYCIPVSVNKLWGISSLNLYAVGNNGNIAHYNGIQWTKIESGTTLNINDIWGDFNNKTGEWEILAVASDFGTSLEKEILQIKNNVVTKHQLSSQMWPLKAVWFVPNKQYYVAGAGVYQKRFLTDTQWKNEATDITTYSTTAIRGNDVNDVIGVGAFGDIIHFNGIVWKNDYTEPLLGYGTYGSVEIKNNLLIAVGDNYNQGVILKGKR
jgi:hypothetical protein